MKTGRIGYIDVWRCIAIVMVLVDHLLAWSHPWYQEVAPGIVWRLQPLGKVGVQIFFCISGFVICRGLIIEMQERGTADFRAFYIRRSYRILPPLVLYILAVALLNLAGVFDLRPGQFAQAAAFLCNIETIAKCGWELGHTWSLAYEEQFYLVFPALFSMLALFSRRSRILGLLGGFGTILVVAYGARYPLVRTYASHVICMLAGCACALYWKELAPRLGRLPFSLWALAVLLIPGLRLVVLPPLFLELIYPLVFPLVICIAVFGTPVHNAVARPIFTNPVLIHIGKISYGIYLWQQLATADYGFASPVPALLLVAAVIVAAHFLYLAIELPLIRRGAALARNDVPDSLPLAQAGNTDQLQRSP